MLDKLKMVLGIPLTDTSKDGLLQFVLDTVIGEILNYCHLDVLPPTLENVAVRMAVDFWRVAGYGVEVKQQGIKSVKRGDVTTNFADATEGNVRSIINNYSAQLNAHRKLRW